MEDKTRARALYEELVVENVMTGEAVRHARKAWRGGNPGNVIANIIVAGMIALLYLYLLIGIVRWELDIVMGIQIMELLIITLIAPASVYAAISGEREKATWDALVLTRLTPAQIIAGKLIWRMALLAGVMAAFLLLAFVSLTQSNVGDRPTALAIFVAQLLILAWGLLLSVFGLWVSAKTARSVTSIGVIVASLLGALIMLPMLLMAFGANMDPEYARSGLDSVGVTLSSIHPFLLVGSLGEGRARSHNIHGDPGWGMAVFALYLLITAFLLWRAHLSVKRLSGG